MPVKQISRKYLPYLLPAYVFTTGAVVLIVEIVAIRFLAPFFGNTSYTYTSVISVILMALSIGYYIGGNLADAFPRFRHYFTIIVISGVSLLLSFYLANIWVDDIGRSSSIVFGPIISTVLFFMIPPILIGMLSPYAIKLQSVIVPDKGIGAVSGQIYFWGTFGSIFGSLLCGFYLVPNYTVNSIIIGCSYLLVFVGCTPLVALRSHVNKIVLLFITLLILGLNMTSVFSDQAGSLYSKNGVYERIEISDIEIDGRKARALYQDLATSGVVFIDTDDPTDVAAEYYEYYKLHQLVDNKLDNALVLGGGAYIFPNIILNTQPDTFVDVVEIEPRLIDLSYQYFNLDHSERLTNYVDDARRFLRTTDKRYDVIFNDVFGTYISIPQHLSTREFYQLTKNRLTDDGVFIGNLIANLDDENATLFLSQVKTFREVYPNSYFFAVESTSSSSLQNIIFFALKSDDRAVDLNQLDPTDDFFESLKSRQIRYEGLDLSKVPVFTDNYAPVEANINSLIFNLSF